jgi:hypothetical protein
MKKLLSISVLIIAVAFASACGSGPGGSGSASITAPWDSMSLPVKEKARVLSSSTSELKVMHEDDKPPVLAAYQGALIANGWKPVGGKSEATNATLDFQKDGKSLELQIFDAEKTGATLKMK